MDNNENRLYFKVGSNVVSVPKEDMANRIIDCAKVEVLMWTEQEPFYIFEHNDLAQHIAENENLECFAGLETPDSLIDQEILEIMKKKAKEKKASSFIYSGLGARRMLRGATVAALRGETRRIARKLRSFPDYDYATSIEERLGVNKKTDKSQQVKVRVGIK